MNYFLTFIIGIMSGAVVAVGLPYVKEKFYASLSFPRVFKKVMSLYSSIRSDGYDPDYIIGIDRSGCMIASMLSGYFGELTIMAAATETVRMPDGARKARLCESHLLNKDVLSGKKILIVSCFVDTGSSMEVVHEYYCSSQPPPSEIRTAALFITARPRFRPKYFVHQVGRDMNVPINKLMHKMPWMSKDRKHVLSDESLPTASR
jgi:hypoxanthine phosphoribosyltransferase